MILYFFFIVLKYTFDKVLFFCFLPDGVRELVDRRDPVVFFFIEDFLLFPEVLIICMDKLFSLSLELRSMDTVRLVDFVLSRIKISF
jgi:hypothetical protein